MTVTELARGLLACDAVGVHDPGASGSTLDRAGHCLVEAQTTRAGAVEAFELEISSALLDDIERVRIATSHRLKAFEREGLEAFVDLAPQRALLDALVAAERDAAAQLRRALRRHPLGPWVRATIGVGEKQGARLIAAIGDPYINMAAGRPRRGPGELWAYCGLHVDDAAHRPQRRRGHRANWNAEAKARAILVAESCIKKRHSPYREVYDRERAKWATRDTTDMHRHRHALGVVAKSVLRDLYLAARDAHVGEGAAVR